MFHRLKASELRVLISRGEFYMSSGVVGVGGLGETIRRILGRLAPVEAKGEAHDREIRELRERAEKAQGDLDRLQKITNHQGKALEDHNRKIASLSEDLEQLEADAEANEVQVKNLVSTVRGEQIKRGKAMARAARAEESLGRIRK